MPCVTINYFTEELALLKALQKASEVYEMTTRLNGKTLRVTQMEHENATHISFVTPDEYAFIIGV